MEGLRKDKLERLFEDQAKLNDNIMAKRVGISNFTDKCFMEHQSGEPLMATSLVNTWLRNFSQALKDEVRELDEELPWKWWSKDPLDMQNIRVEIVDQLHFVISLALTAGMGAEDVFRIYQQKNKVNLARLQNGYSKATKDESDNKGIK